MKEKYVKPALYVESFALSQSIAVVCTGIARAGNWHGRPTMDDDRTCGWETNGGPTLFYSQIACDFDLSEFDSFEWGDYCFNNPSDVHGLFSSG